MSAAAALIAPATSSAAETPSKGGAFSYGQSGRYTLGGSWYLKRDLTNLGLKFNWQATTNFASWQKVSIPNAFNAGDASEASYTGYTAWYATQFKRPSAPSGSNWILQFNGVNLRARIYLNGRLIGTHTGGYIPFEIQASKLRAGTNTLIVRTDSKLTESSVPSVEERSDQLTGGWWNFGGMLREVVLRRVGKFDVSSVDTRSYFTASKGKAKGSARITVLAKVRNYGKKARLKLTGRYGSAKIKFRRTLLKKGASAQLVGTATVKKPKLWSPLAANLYKVKVSAPGVTWSSKAGIRKLAVSSKGILSLNGLPVQLRGVSFHESSTSTGAAWTPTQREENNQLFLKLGVNMIRTHYPVAPQQMEWADAHGVFVWEQVPAFRPRNTQLRSATYRRTVVKYTKEIVQRYRGYASVLTWSLSNEAVPSDTKYLDLMTSAQVKAAKALDPQGLTSADYAASPTDSKQQPAYRRVDILGLNEYFGWYPGQFGTTMSMSDMAPYIAYLHRIYAKQALFITEFGAEANRHGSADEFGTYEFQTNFFTAQLSILRGIPYLNGLFAWALRDYWVRPQWTGGNPDPTPPFSRKGLFEADGTAKPAEEVVAREFKATPPFKN
ncbi:MAG: glycoside hydrolase family 2 TIM barrel-domain containing protein [Solirubrobacterales bacterium]